MVPRKHRAPVGAPVTPATPPDSAPTRRRRLTVALSGIAAVATPSEGTAAAQLAFKETGAEQEASGVGSPPGCRSRGTWGTARTPRRTRSAPTPAACPPTSACPNRPGYLSDVQGSWSRLGMDPGRTTGTLPFQTVQQTIDANSPVEVGIYWTSGGGHAQVLYGYDASRQTLMYADPWPRSPRYAEMNYTTYRSNSQFRWAESLYGEK